MRARTYACAHAGAAAAALVLTPTECARPAALLLARSRQRAPVLLLVVAVLRRVPVLLACLQIAAGAEVILTQPPMDWGAFEAWMDDAHARGLHTAARLVVGFPCISSAGNVAFWAALCQAGGNAEVRRTDSCRAGAAAVLPGMLALCLQPGSWQRTFLLLLSLACSLAVQAAAAAVWRRRGGGQGSQGSRWQQHWKQRRRLVHAAVEPAAAGEAAADAGGRGAACDAHHSSCQAHCAGLCARRRPGTLGLAAGARQHCRQQQPATTGRTGLTGGRSVHPGYPLSSVSQRCKMRFA